MITQARLLSTLGFESKVWHDGKHMTISFKRDHETTVCYDIELECEYDLIKPVDNEFVSKIRNSELQEYIDDIITGCETSDAEDSD